jgi:hypothetical protein
VYNCFVLAVHFNCPEDLGNNFKVWYRVNFFYDVYINRLKPSGYYKYRLFNIHEFYVLPTQCIYVFCVDLRTNSDYFTVQH